MLKPASVRVRELLDWKRTRYYGIEGNLFNLVRRSSPGQTKSHNFSSPSVTVLGYPTRRNTLVRNSSTTWRAVLYSVSFLSPQLCVFQEPTNEQPSFSSYLRAVQQGQVSAFVLAGGPLEEDCRRVCPRQKKKDNSALAAIGVTH